MKHIILAAVFFATPAASQDCVAVEREVAQITEHLRAALEGLKAIRVGSAVSAISADDSQAMNALGDVAAEVAETQLDVARSVVALAEAAGC